MESRYFPELEVVLEKNHDSWVLVDYQNIRLYQLNETGRIIWEELRAGNDIAGIAEKLHGTYPEIAYQVVYQDTVAIVAMLKKEGLVSQGTGA